MLKLSVFSWRPWRLGGSIAFVFAFSAPSSLRSAESTDAADMSELTAALSGCSRASTLLFVPIQRHPPAFPFAISADEPPQLAH